MEDCYYFLYSECKLGSKCSFRHNEQSKKNFVLCKSWKSGKLCHKSCPFRHSLHHLNKPRTDMMCYWETRGGCKKAECEFKHIDASKDEWKDVRIKTLEELRRESFVRRGDEHTENEKVENRKDKRVDNSRMIVEYSGNEKMMVEYSENEKMMNEYSENKHVENRDGTRYLENRDIYVENRDGAREKEYSDKEYVENRDGAREKEYSDKEYVENRDGDREKEYSENKHAENRNGAREKEYVENRDCDRYREKEYVENRDGARFPEGQHKDVQNLSGVENIFGDVERTNEIANHSVKSIKEPTNAINQVELTVNQVELTVNQVEATEYDTVNQVELTAAQVEDTGYNVNQVARNIIPKNQDKQKTLKRHFDLPEVKRPKDNEDSLIEELDRELMELDDLLEE